MSDNKCKTLHPRACFIYRSEVKTMAVGRCKQQDMKDHINLGGPCSIHMDQVKAFLPCFNPFLLNTITVENNYPLSLTMEIIDTLLEAEKLTCLESVQRRQRKSGDFENAVWTHWYPKIFSAFPPQTTAWLYCNGHHHLLRGNTDVYQEGS